MNRTSNPTAWGSVLRGFPRAFDRKPIWAQLNITRQCNLRCGYCTEYDNSQGHVPAADVIARIDHCKELGVLHTDLIGGEPLLHPEFVPLMHHVVRSGMSTGMTTNGFLLTEDKLKELVDLGMGRIQISVDRLTPLPDTPKSLKTLQGKIDMVARQGLWFYVAAVLSPQTIDEAIPLADQCFAMGVPIFFALLHESGRLRPSPHDARTLESLNWLRQQKREGKPVENPYYLIRTFERALQGKPVRWTCMGGHKAFTVSPEGNLHACAHVPALRPFLEVTAKDLRQLGRPKGCEQGCGVDCMMRTSLPFSNRAWVVSLELAERVRGLGSRLWKKAPRGSRASD